MAYYAVAKGRTIGIFRAWYKAEQQVNKFTGNQHMKFDTIQEAREYLRGNGLIVPEVKKGRPRKDGGEGQIKEPIYDPESGDTGTGPMGR